MTHKKNKKFNVLLHSAYSLRSAGGFSCSAKTLQVGIRKNLHLLIKKKKISTSIFLNILVIKNFDLDPDPKHRCRHDDQTQEGKL
jgi:hypothetical protein